MGWGHGIVDGREVGYLVDAECDVAACSTGIDRGLAYRCGGTGNLQSGEDGCGAYVCAEHNYMGTCEVCVPEAGPAACPACLGEGAWFRYLGEGDSSTIDCDICDGTGAAS